MRNRSRIMIMLVTHVVLVLALAMAGCSAEEVGVLHTFEDRSHTDQPHEGQSEHNLPYKSSLIWDFSRGTQGFQATNGVSPLRIVDGALRVRVTGFDPYFHSPQTSLVGERDRFALFRLRASDGHQLKIYFTTPTGGWSEARSLSFDIIADGEMRDYWVDLSRQAAWSGPITQLRFDLEPPDVAGAVLDIERISLFKVGPSLDLLNLRQSLGSVRPGQPVEVSADLANSGGEMIEGLKWHMTAPQGLEIEGSVEGDLDRLDLSGAVPLKWVMTPQHAGTYNVELTVSSDTLGESRFTLPLGVTVAPPDPETIAAGEGARITDDGLVVIEKQGHRLVYPSSGDGYGEGVLYGKSEGVWQQIAVLPPPSIMLDHADRREHAILSATEVRLVGGVDDEEKVASEVASEAESQAASQAPSPAGGIGEPEYGVVFEGVHLDVVGNEWTFSMEVMARDEWYDVALKVRPDREGKLLLLEGLTLLAGEGSFGTEKTGALFPGLEWLTATERSSDTIDAHPPLDLRVAPHPLKVTVPHMAVVSRGFLVGLMWDPLQHWADGQSMPVARFASPNWLGAQDNHYMGLTVPSIDAWVNENELVAHTPFALSPGQTVSITGQITITQTDDVLTAVDLFYEKYGIPDVGELPRTWEEQRRLMTHAYMESYWIPETKGWGHVYGWEPQPFPGLNETLRMLADRETELDLRERMLARVNEVGVAGALSHGPGWLGTSAGGHIELRTYPFYEGFIFPALDGWQAQVRDRIANQQADGHWVFDPGDDPMIQALGVRGERALGLTAVPAWDVLRFARVTGDPAATTAGLKALEAMRDFRVPRAAQTWEVPVHSPDILASAKAAGAYIEGYRITQDETYLADAVYWAKTGLPFIYTWGPEDRPVMPYATIPIFGATHYVLPWFARPVQWNGLVYAYHLMELAPLNPDFPWEEIARGIVFSAMRQQRTEEPAKGGFTDVWELIPNQPIIDVDISPETIAKPAVFVFEGEDPGIHTAVVSVGDTTVRINALAAIQDVESTKERLSFRVPYFESATTHVLIIGLDRPETVEINAIPFTETSFLERFDEGWTFRNSLRGGQLVIKMQHTGASQVDIIHRLSE